MYRNVIIVDMQNFIYNLLFFKKVFYVLIYPLFQGKSGFSLFFRMGIENYLIFQPAKFRAQRVNRNLLNKFKTVRFASLDGARLFGWFTPPDTDKPTILYLHGQSESILTHQDKVEFALKNGYGIFMLSYRGHYRAWGLPSEKGIYKDAQSAINKLNELGVKTENIIVWGHSLGTAVATNCAANNNVKGLILQSPIKDIYSATCDLAAFYLRRIKNKFLRKYLKKHIKDITFIQKFDNINKIAKVKCPILIAHSKTDRITPSKNARELYDKKINAQIFLAERGGHRETKWCIKKISEFIGNL